MEVINIQTEADKPKRIIKKYTSKEWIKKTIKDIEDRVNELRDLQKKAYEQYKARINDLSIARNHYMNVLSDLK